MNKDWVIQVQGSHYYTNKSKNDDRLDFNFYDAVVFKNQLKDEVTSFAEELYKNVRCFWNVMEYNEALKEYEDKTFITINNKRYKYGKYVDIKEALMLTKNDTMVVCKFNDGSKELLSKNNTFVSVDSILNGVWRVIEEIEEKYNYESKNN